MFILDDLDGFDQLIDFIRGGSDIQLCRDDRTFSLLLF